MIGLGVDAGGTYTDSVIVDTASGRILCSSKAPTTHSDVSEGIRASLEGLDGGLLRDAALVSLSSTLATNSVVEGKGCRVGILCIGRDFEGRGSEPYARVKGSFTMKGEEDVPFDEEAAARFLESLKGEVDAVAVAGYLSVRNPSHEERAAELVRGILGVPVACTHDLTSRLGFEERASTAVMNARLIPVVDDLLCSMRRVLSGFGMDAPLMVVKGDGSLMSEEEARRRPVETVLSGPASSFTGAGFLTGMEEAVIVDMGGTTSDIGIIRGGVPAIEPEGALIAGRRSRVTAADISTFGIGGDSRIVVDGRRISIAPTRAVPICMAARRWASIKEEVAALEGVTDDRASGERDPRRIVQDTEFFTLAHMPEPGYLKPDEERFLRLVGERPRRISDAMEELGLPLRAVDASALESRGAVLRIGVTPTDILHAEGTLDLHDREASAVAVGYLSRRAGMDAGGFIREVKAMVCAEIASGVMEKVVLDGSGRDSLSESDACLIRECLRTRRDYGVEYHLKLPLIGIGAPVRAWLPGAADILHAELIVPEHSEIGNAVGTVVGAVRETAEVDVRACGDIRGPEPRCIVFSDGGATELPSPDEALAYAERECARMARARAVASGCPDPAVSVSRDAEYAEVSAETRIFRRAVVRAVAAGKPGMSRGDSGDARFRRIGPS